MKAKPLRATVELVLTVAAAIFFALTIQAFAVKPYRIPSGSMLPTLEPGQRILVNRFSHHVGADPKLGDVTVFLPPKGALTGTCGHAGEGPGNDGRSARPAAPARNRPPPTPTPRSSSAWSGCRVTRSRSSTAT